MCSDTYKNIPRVLPDSNASQGVDAINRLLTGHPGELTSAELEKGVRDTLTSHGSDSVTAATAAKTVTELSEGQSLEQTRKIAENVVGVTLSDPQLAVEDASKRVNRRIREGGIPLAQLSPENKKAIAFEEGQSALKRAGVTDTKSSQALRAKVNSNIDQGMSPALAAAAAVAAVVAAAMFSADASSFDIFGYLIMLVTGDTTITYKSTETLKVANNAIHTHLSNTTYEMAGHNFRIDCDVVKTQQVGDDTRNHSGFSQGNYYGSYDSETPISFSAFAANVKYGKDAESYGIFSLTACAGRLYLAVQDMDVGGVFGIKEGRDKRSGILQGDSGGHNQQSAPLHNVKN